MSIEGGTEPVWAPSGDELFYRNGDAVVAAALDAGSELSVREQTTLFEGRFRAAERVDSNRAWDMHPDGERFLLIQPVNDARPGEIHVVLNWFEELQARVPTGR